MDPSCIFPFGCPLKKTLWRHGINTEKTHKNMCLWENTYMNDVTMSESYVVQTQAPGAVPAWSLLIDLNDFN